MWFGLAFSYSLTLARDSQAKLAANPAEVLVTRANGHKSLDYELEKIEMGKVTKKALDGTYY